MRLRPSTHSLSVLLARRRVIATYTPPGDCFKRGSRDESPCKPGPELGAGVDGNRGGGGGAGGGGGGGIGSPALKLLSSPSSRILTERDDEEPDSGATMVAKLRFIERANGETSFINNIFIIFFMPLTCSLSSLLSASSFWMRSLASCIGMVLVLRLRFGLASLVTIFVEMFTHQV